MVNRLWCLATAIAALMMAIAAPAANSAPPAKNPTLSVDDVSVAEGDSGTTPAVFTVRMSAAAAKVVSVDFATADGGATSANDYAATSGTVTLAKGQTSKQVTVNVVGDTSVEPDETFFLRLSRPVNAVIGDGEGQGTIRNDDVPPTPAATAYQLNPAHTGVVADAVAANPAQAWSRDLGGLVSYPLIAGGRVYVTVANEGVYGTKLLALDATTGNPVWGPVSLGGTYFWSAITYDAGQVFALNYDGVMSAFNATSGALNWSANMPGQYSFSSAPTARNGLVYTGGAGSGGTVYAVRETNGTVAWTARVQNGDTSSPAVSSTGVYVSYACGQSYDFAPASGALLWYRSTACEGGGGKTPVLAGGKLYVRDFSYPAILDAATGAQLGPYQSNGPAPAVDASSRYILSSGTLRAEDVASGSTRWSFAGDGGLTSAPIVAGATVFVGSSTGRLYGLSTATGAVTWSTLVGSAIPAPDEQNVSQPLTGLATSGGLVVVPAGRILAAYR